MRRLCILLLLASCVLFSSAWGEPAQVAGLRMWPAPDNTRIVFDTSGPVEHSLFTLANPDRLVIDLKNATLARPFSGLDFAKGLVKNIRTGTQNDNADLRVVLDLKGPVKPKSFPLGPGQGYGHRLVVDLQDLSLPATAPVSAPVPRMTAEATAVRDIVIAIDAGHGGDDPGAIGPGGTREKDVVLAVAQRLQALVAAEGGMRAVMIRDGDYFVSLHGRIQKAREQKADLFVSVHADAFRNRTARGSSVFTLSQRGASSEYARLLADKENASDLVGGVSLDDKDDLLASVLLDLSQTATIEASSEVASRVLGQLSGIGRLHTGRVEQAGFRVLKAPDVPSLLVETAFISNPEEERKLRDPDHQAALAKAIMSGLRSYFRHNPPPGTRLAAEMRQREVAVAEGAAARSSEPRTN